VRGYAEVLGTGDLPRAEQERVVAAIQTETGLLQNLVTDVQTIASIEGDHFTVQPQPIMISHLLSEAANWSRVLPGEPVLQTVIPASGEVWADRERILQVLRNLLANAARYSPAGTPIELRAKRAGDRVRIKVVDRGPGIDSKDMDRIFEKFFRGQQPGSCQAPGAGLGLYLSRQIVRAHGSDLIVRSTPGGGATFAFDLTVVGGKSQLIMS